MFLESADRWPTRASVTRRLVILHASAITTAPSVAANSTAMVLKMYIFRLGGRTEQRTLSSHDLESNLDKPKHPPIQLLRPAYKSPALSNAVELQFVGPLFFFHLEES